MAPKRATLFIPPPGIFLWICASFIMLSGTATCERQCYWCGPLAEQVHRSRRAPSCEHPTEHMTTCEPGFKYCAVVATSPPHVESRFCVKLYQDECYPLFCNSTKTWKMTCPCRGDLCNGINTARENQAFAVLSKLVTKTQNIRMKKREISTSNLISTNQERTTIITNVTVMQLNQNNDGNEINEKDNETGQMIVVTGTAREGLIKENLMIDIPTTPRPITNVTDMQLISNEDEQLNVVTATAQEVSVKENLRIDIPTTPRSITNVTAMNQVSNFNETENMIIVTATVREGLVVENLSIDNPTTSFDQHEKVNNSVSNITPHKSIDDVKTEHVASQNTEIEINAPTTTMTAGTKVIKESLAHNSNMKPSEQLPTAEALQQNVNPSVTSLRTTDSVRIDSTDLSTPETVDSTTTEPIKESENLAGRLSAKKFVLVIGLLTITFKC